MTAPLRIVRSHWLRKSTVHVIPCLYLVLQRWRTTLWPLAVAPDRCRAAKLLACEIWGRPEFEAGLALPTGAGAAHGLVDPGVGRETQWRPPVFLLIVFPFSPLTGGWRTCKTTIGGSTFFCSPKGLCWSLSRTIGASTSLPHWDHIFLVPPPGCESGDRDFGRPFKRTFRETMDR